MNKEEKNPLANRIRPTSLDDFIGQTHLIERIKAFMRSKRLPSILFFGPPGCGKSTLAILLAQNSGLPYIRLSAPETGLPALRSRLSGKEVLILDELHRFSKAQQDFFLPILETGEVIMLATTTENPSFSVTKQLLSRMHVLRLRPLNHIELVALAKRGQEALGLELPEDSESFLVSAAGGDGRMLLNILEYVAELSPEEQTLEVLKSRLPEIVLRGDRDGDSHYELASALIKSIRGSDPDAALYYLACLLESGEDPRFVCRRLILSASEDVGLGDPKALPLAVACAQAVEMVGMPEGFIPMAETCVYLALAPKNNSTYAAYLAAKKEIAQNGAHPVPEHLRNPSTKLHKEWGYGKGYKYPHAFPGGFVEQDYLPKELVGRRFYHPKDIGEERKLTSWSKIKKGKN